MKTFEVIIITHPVSDDMGTQFKKIKIEADKMRVDIGEPLVDFITDGHVTATVPSDKCIINILKGDQ